MKRQLYANILTVSLLVCFALLAGCSSNATTGVGNISPNNEGAPASPTITVTAKSEVAAVPDRAKIGIAVTTQASSAQATQEQNAEDINAVIEALRSLGIDETSIQTTDTWLNPRYDYNNYEPVTTEDFPAVEIADEDDATNIVGYEMTTRLSVADLEIDRVGEVLQTCVAAGATNSDGIQYYSSEYDTKYAEALTAAIEDARTKAEVLAQASGTTLGGVFSITEGYQNTAYSYDNNIALEAASDEAASMKVMPGEIKIEANVTISYEIS